MKISIFGLGYVGTVSAGCLASYGHSIVGVDTNALKVDSICKGESPVVEPGVDELLRRGVAEGRLSATTDPHHAVLESDCSLVCVGTPSRSNGSLNLDQVFAVGRQIGTALKDKEGYHAVALRSTVLPGTLGRLAAIIEEVSGRKLGQDFGVASNPEFLREGTALADFEHPPFTIIGPSDERVANLMRELYAPVSAPFITMEIRAAELLKYACNSFHAMKVAFANEIGAVSKQLGVDSHEV
ncbi:MAG TPA: nucleotide sugar dehydrogenase, partial [Bacteroidota bacterium]